LRQLVFAIRRYFRLNKIHSSKNEISLRGLPISHKSITMLSQIAFPQHSCCVGVQRASQGAKAQCVVLVSECCQTSSATIDGTREFMAKVIDLRSRTIFEDNLTCISWLTPPTCRSPRCASRRPSMLINRGRCKDFHGALRSCAHRECRLKSKAVYCLDLKATSRRRK
jgi:hypothetical protein